MTVLPALAAAHAGGILVGNGRGRVVHIATPGGAGLTPLGRLRRGSRPLCGQHARAWRCWPVDGRPLCARCARRRPGILPAPRLPREQLARLLADTLATARDEATLAAARLAVCSSCPGQLVDGQPLHRHVALAQRRLNPAPARTSAWPATTARSRRAAAHDRFAALVDLGGTT
jgi:hypothetical protein